MMILQSIIIYKYKRIVITEMSQPTMPRKRTHSLKTKLHSEQSSLVRPRHSLTKILNDNIAKRRRTTLNSPEHSKHHLQAQIDKAKQAYRNRDTKNALQLWKKLFRKHPDNCEIPYFVGSCYMNEGDFESALGYFKVCLTLDPGFNKNVYIYMAICLKSLHKYEQAIEVLEIGLEKYAQFADGHFYKGKLLMKVKKYDKAAQAFRKCVGIEKSGNEQAVLYWGDCLKNLGQWEQALDKYTAVIANSRASETNLAEKAVVKKASLLIQHKQYKKALQTLNLPIVSHNHNAQMHFLRSICQYEQGNYNQAITLCEMCLGYSLPEWQLVKALQLLIQISIRQKDFFGAEHLISRCKFLNIGQKQFQLYYLLVQGINDLIKKRTLQSQEKLKHVYSTAVNAQTSDSGRFLFQSAAPYYAYCLFTNQKYEQAVQVYGKYLSMASEPGVLERYNMLICEGIVKHVYREYAQAEGKFREASMLIPSKSEPYFMICVNAVQENKKLLSTVNPANSQNSHSQNAQLQNLLSKLSTLFDSASQLTPINSLLLFYHSLFLLHNQYDANATITRAIASSQQQVSEYFFIQALALFNAQQPMRGLESINKAIQIDGNIPQFYKQRSKYLYIMQRYDEAVSDIVRVLQQTQDEQAKLLLTFYYYMTNQYQLSLQLLQEITQHSQEDKFKQFQYALHLRLHKFTQCPPVGSVLQCIISGTTLDEYNLQQMVALAARREVYSELSGYHYHLILGAYWFYGGEYGECLGHLFVCLEELRQMGEEDAVVVEVMCNQVKFDIVLAVLAKEAKERKQIKQAKDGVKGKEQTIRESQRYLEMFISETEDPEFVGLMSEILARVKMADHGNSGKERMNVRVELYPQLNKISSLFPQKVIEIGQGIAITTQFMITYPHKLKFNICPQFDESFLFNFDIDKVQSKLCPPWFKLHEGQLYFTDKIRNQSVLISETDKCVSPSLMGQSPVRENLKEKFRLDEAIEKKLQKIMKKQAKSEKTYKSKPTTTNI